MSKQLDRILKKRPEAVVQTEPDTQPVLVAHPPAKAAPKPATARHEPAVTPHEDDAPLGVMVPASVKQALNVKSAMEGKTNRQLVLIGLKSVGIDVPEHELRDKRKPDAAERHKGKSHA